MATPTIAATMDEDVEIALGRFQLSGRLTVPERARGVIVFAHDAGGDFRDLGDRHVAAALQSCGFGTLLFNLATPEESDSGDRVFDLDVLAVRLLVATRWLRAQPSARGSDVAYFGTRAGAAVAVLAAGDDRTLGALVVRSARLDLVGSAIPTVHAPTLLLVGGSDLPSRAVNERSASELHCPHELAVVPGVSELFVEPGALDACARLTAAWCSRHLLHPPKENHTP
jgi:putative phosphoribosyl transferase